MKTFCFAKDQITYSENASLHPLDIGLIRGYGIFDFLRTVDYQPLFLDEYLLRFENSSRKTYLPLDYSKDELKQIILNLIDKNDLREGGIRMILTGGISSNYFSPGKGNLYIFCEDLKMPAPEKYELGVMLQPQEYVRPMASIKTTNYTYPVWLSREWESRGAEDLIYHDHSGIISESSRSNIFMLKNGIVKTPKSNILQGITRKNTMDLIEVYEETDITLKELKNADEVFITSTTKKILPITKIGEEIIGIGKAGPFTYSLMADFQKLEIRMLENGKIIKGD